MESIFKKTDELGEKVDELGMSFIVGEWDEGVLEDKRTPYVLVCGGTGTGKTYSILTSNIVCMNHSAIIAGCYEYENTFDFVKKEGCKVYEVDFYNEKVDAGFRLKLSYEALSELIELEGEDESKLLKLTIRCLNAMQNEGESPTYNDLWDTLNMLAQERKRTLDYFERIAVENKNYDDAQFIKQLTDMPATKYNAVLLYLLASLNFLANDFYRELFSCSDRSKTLDICELYKSVAYVNLKSNWTKNEFSIIRFICRSLYDELSAYDGEKQNGICYYFDEVPCVPQNLSSLIKESRQNDRHIGFVVCAQSAEMVMEYFGDFLRKEAIESFDVYISLDSNIKLWVKETLELFSRVTGFTEYRVLDGDYIPFGERLFIKNKCAIMCGKPNPKHFME